jgi:hypothetical protein
MREGLENFFLSTHFFAHDKARCLGWKGAKAAIRLIKDAERQFRKKSSG